MVEPPGLVDVRDLAHRYMWNERQVARAIAAVGLIVEGRPYRRAFEPPRVVIVIARYDQPERVEALHPWLARCTHVALVRDGHDGAVPIGDEAELCEIFDEQWRTLQRRLSATAVFDWFDEPAPLRAAIAWACERAGPAATEEVAPLDRVLPISPWVPWSGLAHPDDAAAAFACRLATDAGHAVLAGIDLAHLRAPVLIREHSTPEHDAIRRTASCGRDPVHPVAWRGHRMAVYWWYRHGFLSATDHDFPCGPAKKLWGFANNDPVAVALAPAGDYCAQTFEHDVLLTANVPVGWHRAGDVDVAAFAPDPRRATLYAYTDDFAVRLTGDPTDEDNRELAPVVVLGPSEAVRYAVDLRHHVVRIRGARGDATAERIGGDALTPSFAVFDADHQLVRHAAGTLLGGWFRHATVEYAGALWREDLATGARGFLASNARVICVDPEVESIVQDALREGRHDAVAALRAAHPVHELAAPTAVIAIPGTRNVLEICGDRLRVL